MKKSKYPVNKEVDVGMIKKRFSRYFGLAVYFLMLIIFMGCATERMNRKVKDKGYQAVDETEDESLDKAKDTIKEKVLPW